MRKTRRRAEHLAILLCGLLLAVPVQPSRANEMSRFLRMWLQTSSRVGEHGQFQIDPAASAPLGNGIRGAPGTCRIRAMNGFPLPDPACTPGAINPTVTINTLRSPSFRTRYLRNHATSEWQKAETYAWYGEYHPDHNFGPTQTCELDHVVPLELGGADTLDNIFPQCGPNGAPLEARFFKRKDTVENYLAYMVKTGRISLTAAQRGIAANWTQYLATAEATCPNGRCPYGQTDRNSAATIGAPAGAGLFTTEAKAQQHCPSDTVVWVNTATGIYHFKGTRWYGATSRGAFGCKKEADKTNFRATRERP